MNPSLPEEASIPFEVYIDDLKGVRCSASYSIGSHNFVLGILNDFEDGKWRLPKFTNFIWDNIGQTALSLRERNALALNPHSTLRAAAQNLRLIDSDDDPGEGSEIAEIVLYAIMRHHYAALPAVPKIFYKQNARDYAKGADSIHLVLDDNGDFSLWMGEAKFYNGIENSRFDKVIRSLGEMLSTEKLRKENSIITNLRDLDGCISEKQTLENIYRLLDVNTSIDLLKPKLNIPILLLHECKNTQKTAEYTSMYVEDMFREHSQRAAEFFGKKLSALGNIHKFNEIKFHLILFPVAKKAEVVGAFLRDVRHYRS